LQVLVVRPDDSLALSPTLRFEIPRDDGLALPGELLRLATAIKQGTRHSVTLHDARRAPEGNRSLRSLVKQLAPDLCVLWIHPATLEDGLEAARAVRQSGGSVIVGTGPLVDLWPDGACRIPELDGLLPKHSSGGLCAALEVLERGGSGKALIESLTTSSPPPNSGVPMERNLLDYAGYRRSLDALWPPLHADPVDRLRQRLLPRKNGRGQPAVSSVLLLDELGHPHEPSAVIEDIVACTALGIRWIDLCVAPHGSILESSWFVRLFSELSRCRAAAPGVHYLRAPLSPAMLDELGMQRLRAAGVSAVDLGTVNGGDAAALGDAVAAARRCRQAGLFPTGVLVLGCSGYDLEEDRHGVSTAIRAAFPSTAGVDIRMGTVDAGRWSDWLDAPGIDFNPPGLDNERLVLADRARLALQARWRRSSGLRGSVEQFLRR